MKFSDEQKQQLVARCYNGESVSDICLQSGIARSTLYTWLKPYRSTLTKSGLVVSVNEFTRMKKKLQKSEQKIEVLQQVNCTASSPLRERLDELALLHGKYSVHVLCEALKVDRGTFYNHIYRSKKGNSWYQIRRMELSEQIRRVYDESNQIYGAEKIKVVLSAQGVAVSDKMVAELMNEMNLQSIRIGSEKNYDRFNREKKRDSLKMNFSVTAPNQVWVSDVTYFKLMEKRITYALSLICFPGKSLPIKFQRNTPLNLLQPPLK